MTPKEDDLKKIEPVHCSCGKETFKIYNLNDVEFILTCGECGTIWYVVKRTFKGHKKQ